MDSIGNPDCKLDAQYRLLDQVAQVKVVNCKLCGHTARAHSNNGNYAGGSCMVPIEISAKVDGHIQKTGPERWVLCSCPTMVYNVYRRHWVKVDYRLDRRLTDYLNGMGGKKKLGEVVPGKVDVIRQAIEEFLHKRGY